MKSKDFGKLIVAVRKQRTDEDGKVLTQVKLAQEINLSKEIVGSIERGGKANLNSDILLALAKALELTNAERKEFFIAASGIENESIPQDDPPEVVLGELLRIMEQIHLPSFIMDSFGDIVAINPAALKMYNTDLSVFQDSHVKPAIRPVKWSTMRFVFSPEFDSQRKMMGESWLQFAHSTMAIFRARSFRYRAHPYFRYIFPKLNKEFRLFRSYWQVAPFQEYKQFADNTFLSMRYPGVGAIHTVSSSITAITMHGELLLYSFIPLSLETAEAFLGIIKQEGTRAQLVAPWPDKPTPKNE